MGGRSDVATDWSHRVRRVESGFFFLFFFFPPPPTAEACFTLSNASLEWGAPPFLSGCTNNIFLRKCFFTSSVSAVTGTFAYGRTVAPSLPLKVRGMRGFINSMSCKYKRWCGRLTRVYRCLHSLNWSFLNRREI